MAAEGDPQGLEGTPTNHHMGEKEEQGWAERTEDSTHNHRLGDTGHDTADTHEVVAHRPEDIQIVGEASPQAGNLNLVSREETSTYLKRTPGMGAEHRRDGHRSWTSITGTKLGNKNIILIVHTR